MPKFSYKLAILIFAIVLLLPLTNVKAQSIGFGGEGNGTVNIIASTGFFNTAVARDDFLDTTFGQLIAIFLGFLGAIFLALIVYSGFQWMTAGGNEEKVADAKKRILNASLGIGLVFFSYIITNIVFNFINQQEEAAPTNEQNECEVDANCPAETPLCETFITQGGEAKWCTCFRDRGPACPEGKTCNENIGGRNNCELD